ncbi:carotenoid oxygenase [Ilyonectria robusta]|uniref:carotenoid oxygenase n=1 Tax=Ilyonectria robusta TaxID=1079257 RepID=UPI001E8D7DB7|nr:carotenoid oxygenase [Ilyonectria robusta]KAH8656325.1 carotenoid oxygenase [Ilyonectria robusta]
MGVNHQSENRQSEIPGVLEPPPGSNPLSWGFYATREIQEPTALQVEGNIPTWLTGSLYRGGAGTWDVGNYTAEHWFDGFSRNHRFEIANGTVKYRSRNSTDEMINFARETGRIPDGSFGSDPCKIIYGAMETTFRDGNNTRGDPDTCNIGVVFVPNFAGLDRKTTNTGAPFDTLVVATDATKLQQIDPVTLEPIEVFTYQASNPLLTNGGRSAAHPYIAHDGALYNYHLDLTAQPPVYSIFGIQPPSGECKILATITDAPAAYIHALFGTEDHLIHVVSQADYVKPGKTVLDSIGPWRPERKTLFYVVDRVKGGVVSKYESEEAFFAFHQINAFENDAGDIYVDIPVMEDTTFLSAAKVANLRANIGAHDGSSKNDIPATFTRFRLPFKGEGARAADGSLVKHTAEVDFALPYAQANIELPRINCKFHGRPYRYTYGIHVQTPGHFSDSIIKIDTETKEVKTWSPSIKHVASEPIFVPTPGAEREDDGVILTVAMDSAQRASSLVVIDATTMQEIGRARMPIVMGYGFHGTWGSG